MKANLFARPDLKLFLLAALLVIAAKELVIPADSGTLPARLPASLLQGLPPSPEEMDRLLEYALAAPSSKNYMILSEGHRKRGEYRQAMHYLRQARVASEIESLGD